MAYKVEITDSAKEELDAIVRYFVETLANPISAGKLLDDFYKQKSYLCNAPVYVSSLSYAKFATKRIQKIFIYEKLCCVVHC